MASIVRENLLSQKGYEPYCGNGQCRFLMPRMGFDGEQFRCICGYRTNFEPEFIAQVKAFNAAPPQPAEAEAREGR